MSSNKKTDNIIKNARENAKNTSIQIPKSDFLKNERQFEKYEYDSDRHKLHQQMRLLNDISETEYKCRNKPLKEGEFSPECDFKTGSNFDILSIYYKKKKDVMNKIKLLDEEKVINLNELKSNKNKDRTESFIGNIINFENNIREGWTENPTDIDNVKNNINELRKLNNFYKIIIDKSKANQYYLEANKHHDEILKEKTNDYNNTNKINKRSAQYNQKEVDEMDKILIWFKVIYWIGFIVIVFLLFKFKQWRNIKVYIFLLLIIFLPTLLLKPIVDVITKEFFKENVSVNYILYICLLVIFIFALYFFGRLPFVNADKDFYKNSIKKNDELKIDNKSY